MKAEGLSGVNKPKRTPSHPKKSHCVMAKEGDTYKFIRFGQQGVGVMWGELGGASRSFKYAKRLLIARVASIVRKPRQAAIASWKNTMVV